MYTLVRYFQNLLQRKRSFLHKACVLIGVIILVAGCTCLLPETQETDSLDQLSNFPAVPYDTTFEILPYSHHDPENQQDVKAVIHDASNLVRLKDKPPSSTNALRHRIRLDLTNIRKALKSQGYYEAKISARLNASKTPRRVRILVDPGLRYRISGFNIRILDTPQNFDIPPYKLRRAVRVHTGDFVNLDAAFISLEQLERYLRNRGYLYATVAEPIGILNRATKRLFLEFKVTLRGQRTYGKTHIKGLETVSEQFVRNRILWSEGDLYDDRVVQKTKGKLIMTDLFSAIYVTPEDKTARVPMKIDVREGPPRAIGAGVRYATSEGIGGKAYWKHYNLFGGAERFSVDVEGSQKELEGSVSLETPDVMKTNQTFIVRLSSAIQRQRAYSGEIYTLFLGMKNEFLDHCFYGYGLEPEFSELRRHKTEKKRNHSFVGIPLMLSFDASNDLINPYKGWRFKGELTPFIGNFKSSDYILKFFMTGTYYWRLVKRDTLVLAVWGKYGQIYLKDSEDIPLNKRFYSGGSGSVRGYGYQRLGAIRSDRVPLGGQSLVEMGLEPRWRINETIGISCFIEAGDVSQKRTPQFKSKTFLVGYGVGVKYYTDVGPIRLDVAFPTRRRKVNNKKFDSAVQIYLSIGQAF